MKKLKNFLIDMLVLWLLFQLAGSARAAEYIATRQPIVFAFCADPQASSHKLCVDETVSGKETCQTLVGGQSVYSVIVTPPLCTDFRVVAWSYAGSGDTAVSKMSDPSKEYALSPDFRNRGMVGIADYGFFAAHFDQFGVAGFACMQKYFGRPGPLPVAVPEAINCPVPNTLPAEPPVVGP